MAQHAAGDVLHTLARLRTEERPLLENCELLLTAPYLLQPQGIGCAGTLGHDAVPLVPSLHVRPAGACDSPQA